MAVPETFRAFLATQTDGDVERGPTSLSASDLPDGEVTIRVGFSSVNYKDALATIPNGQVAQISPLVPGVDLAGEVVESGEPGLSEGTEVLVTGYGLGVSSHGGWAEYARVPAEWVIPLPDELSAREAMALGTAGFTAGLSIRALERHGLEPSAGPVLVLGATGGVGSIAVAALAAAGYEVHAATGKRDRHDYLHELGAQEILSREETTESSDRPLGKSRWAAVVDPVGGPATAYALRTLRYGGAVALSGLPAGTKLDTTVLPFILRAASVLGIDSVQASREVREEVWSKLAGDWRPAALTDSIASEVDLDGIEPVLDAILSGEVVGRTVVSVGSSSHG